MHTNNLLRPRSTHGDISDRDGGCVGSKDAVFGGYLFNCFHDATLEVNILKHCLNDQIGIAKVLLPACTIIGKTNHVGRVLVVLVLRHASPLDLLAPVIVNVRFSSSNSSIIAILEKDLIALLGRHLSDTGAHQTGTHYCHGLDGMSRFATGILFHLRHAIEDANESIRLRRGGKLGEGFALKLELFVAGRVLQTILDTLDDGVR
mmetsp:Transcript_27135/g.63493  ORF Transcript_27135/g.63493 Transcript_27135/m.63493 type:complete len:205 (+) Transcript_27135:814-1428(+)